MAHAPSTRERAVWPALILGTTASNLAGAVFLYLLMRFALSAAVNRFVTVHMPMFLVVLACSAVLMIAGSLWLGLLPLPVIALIASGQGEGGTNLVVFLLVVMGVLLVLMMAMAFNRPARLTRLLTEMMRLKRDTPVLRRGLFQVLYAQGDCLIMRRYKEKGRYDAFGEELPGLDLALIAVNRSDRPMTPPQGFEDLPLLGPLGGCVVLDGQVRISL